MAYRTIFSSNERARYFTTWYVDAFAGTGSRSEPVASGREPDNLLFDDVYADADSIRYRDGSATIALRLPDPFHKYLFIEKSKARVDELEAAIKKDYPRLFPRCIMWHGDANELLKAWCAERDWTKERAVVFLDPYGMQVEWLLTRAGNIDASWQKRLTAVFGTSEWQSRFYSVRVQEGLFGPLETLERDAPEGKIQDFIQERLDLCFAKTAKGLILRNSRSSPLYLLCFAAANKRGAPTAIKIAQSILDA